MRGIVQNVHPHDYVSGEVQGFYISDDSIRRSPKLPKQITGCPPGWVPANTGSKNDILFGWAEVLQNLLRGSPDGKNYAIAGAYLEFDNSGTDVDPLPSLSRDNPRDYYNSLAAPRDYLRLPITASSVESSDTSKWPRGNTTVFYIQTQGTVGFKNGLTFSDVAGSRVYGGALVAMPGGNDASQDIFYARFYWPTGQQLEKLLGSQIGATWRHRYK